MRSILFFILSVLSISLYSQSIVVNPTEAPESALDAENLTREVLIDGGECSDISNFELIDNPQAQFPNNNRSWGYFEKGTSDFPFESGIVMTSGFARRAVGPSGGIVSDGPGTGWADGSAGQPMDPDASTLADWDTENTTVFEFDFVPFGNEISFNYIFASEEHPTFSCSSTFNDAFGFIISGPGITPDPGLSGKNIATLPNGDWVTINNVNNQGCGDDTYYVPGPFNDIQYGGRTTPLTAYSEVIPGETYHIRLIVTDAGDHQYDSAVFLEAGSFSLGGTIIDMTGAEVGEDETLCDLTQYSLIVNVQAPDAEFQWFFNGEEIPGANTQIYNATETGYYEVLITSGSCSTTVGVNLVFSNSPETENVEDFQCTEDGIYFYDLSSYNENISSPEYIYTYYNTLEGAEEEIELDQILNFDNFEVNSAGGPVTVYVRVENEDGCYEIAELTLEVGIGPETAPASYPECDDDGDGFAEFNMLDFAPNLVLSSTVGLIYEFYLDEAGTQLIPNPEAYTNETAYLQVVYVKIYNPALGDEACPKLEELSLEVGEFPLLQADELIICDNLNDNSEFVDLTNNEIVQTDGINVTYEYYTAAGTLITNPANYEVTSSPTVITVLVKNQAGTCEGSQTFTIEFIQSPEAVDVIMPIVNCSLNEIANYDLTTLNEFLVTGSTANLTFTYHLTQNDAFNNTGALPENYTNVEPDQILFVRIENENGCFDIARIMLDTELIHNELEDSLRACDDPYEISDGITVFDLTLMHEDVENSLGGDNYTIKYYTSFDDALMGINEITNPTQYQNTTSPQTIYAVASDGINGCAGVVDFRIEVLPVPEFELPESVVFCNYDEKNYEFPGVFTSYTWTDSVGNIVSTQNTVSFESEGTYTLEVIGDLNECSAKREIEVIFDTQPIITNIEVNENTVIISATGALAPYQYSIDNGLTWSNNYILQSVPGGIYDLIVKSKYGCISEAKTFGVLGVPNLITPNGDGKNDVWEIRALEAYPDAHIRIFDRYGKMFVDRPLTTDFKWDGKYLGNPVPSGDYWYIITVEEGKSVSGHITVRR
ncbi:choice-of-anchor L domain-containing protein [Moheibacter sp.]|uniref:choice-of-anchor L domain-containing protein n=1 Tax=Moheibacter sp. TaxID=1965316 RepID=UPI003C76F283